MDWCPSHCNIVGNDLADEGAKTGSTHGRELNIKMSKTEAYSRINGYILFRHSNSNSTRESVAGV